MENKKLSQWWCRRSEFGRGNQEFGFSYLKPKMPVRYSDENIEQLVVHEGSKEQSGLDINIWKS